MATVALLAVLAGSGCGGRAAGGAEPSPQPAGGSPDELEVIYRARMDSASRLFTPADVDFMSGMIAHHAQALIMADLAPSHEASPAVRILCARIINAQKDEIATMQQWLRDRAQPVPEVHIEGLALMVHGVGEHHRHMPGMLTPQQLEELDGARGPAFDRLFLERMIQHHQGAVTMVHRLFGTDGAAQDEVVFKIASDIQVDQITEIARMELMLEELTAGPGQ